MSLKIDGSELSKIPFIDKENIGGRALTCLTFHDGEEWHSWLARPDGVHHLKGRPVEADYFGKAPESATDVYLDFLNFMAQRACWIDAVRPIGAVCGDIHNLGASLAKIDVFYELSKERKTETTRFVTTEIEYIFSVCRSLFDLFQKVIGRIWSRIRLNDEGIEKKNLPESFRRMVITDKRAMTSAEIADRWHIPTVLADYYFRQGPFFELLRSYRDQVAHHGRELRSLFVTERGFAVRSDTEPFASFNVWDEMHLLPNQLASVRPVLAHVILETLRACEEFSITIQSIISFPPDIAPGFRLFLRGSYNRELLEMNSIRDSCLWWDEEPERDWEHDSEIA